MSTKVLELQLGAAVHLAGPFGKCVYQDQFADRPILMIGSGTGLAPLYSVASDALQRGHRAPIRLYHGSATEDGLYFMQELAALAHDNPQFSYLQSADIVYSDRPAVGSPLKFALDQIPDLTGWIVFACGHPNLVESAKKRAFLAGASLKEIFADPFVDQSPKLPTEL